MKHYERLDEALQLAAKLHSGQRRDGEFGLPYAIHPFEVVSNLRARGGVTEEDTLIAAALHDVLEETGAKKSMIKQRFGRRVAELLQELTRREPKPRELKERSEEEIWELRSSILLQELAKMSGEAQAIKLADRLSNLWEANRTRTGVRLERYRVQTVAILETIPEEINSKLWKLVKEELEKSSI